MSTRKMTNKLIQQIEDGLTDWETVGIACLSYMSEDDVADMMESNDLIIEDGSDDPWME